MARDQAIEFYTSGCGRRLKKARERRERSLSNLRRRENKDGNFASDESISSNSSSSDEEEEGGARIDTRKPGQGEPGSRRSDATAVSWQEEGFWSDAPSGVFASPSSSSGSSVANGSSDGEYRGSRKRRRRRRRRCSGEGSETDENNGRKGKGRGACGSSDARGMPSRRSSDSEKSSAEEDQDDGREDMLAKLGLRAEFLPLSIGVWEDAVCLGDDDHGSYAFRR